MAVKMSMNATVCSIVLAFGLTSPMVVQAGCIDGGCGPSPLPQSAHGGSSPTQSTGSLEWDIKSNFRYQVGIQFYSETRKGHVWPNHKEIWLLKDSAAHTFRLSCQPGEKICFGAWSMGDGGKTYWGVGDGDKQGCTNCCHTCGDHPRQTDLN
jgi:hypothetical protein